MGAALAESVAKGEGLEAQLAESVAKGEALEAALAESVAKGEALEAQFAESVAKGEGLEAELADTQQQSEEAADAAKYQKEADEADNAAATRALESQLEQFGVQNSALTTELELLKNWLTLESKSRHWKLILWTARNPSRRNEHRWPLQEMRSSSHSKQRTRSIVNWKIKSRTLSANQHNVKMSLAGTCRRWE